MRCHGRVPSLTEHLTRSTALKALRKSSTFFAAGQPYLRYRSRCGTATISVEPCRILTTLELLTSEVTVASGKTALTSAVALSRSCVPPSQLWPNVTLKVCSHLAILVGCKRQQ